MRERAGYLLRVALIVAMPAVLLSACDSEEEATDAELLVDTWRVVGLEDGSGDRTEVLTELGELTVRFTASDYEIDLDANDDELDRNVSGSYTIDQDEKEVTLQVDFQGIALPLTVEYGFAGEDELTLSLSGAILSQILGGSFTGTVTLTLERR